MFPERQLGPHRDWKQEVEYLDSIFQHGAAYTVGKVNGDHWLLYLTSPGASRGVEASPPSPVKPLGEPFPDYTIEILMSDLSLDARQPFFTPQASPEDPSSLAQTLSESIGISRIFPASLTTLDAYAFSPCGYSSNALIRWGEDVLSCQENGTTGSKSGSGEGYYTIHVTPEEGWSYASFECNVPLPPSHSSTPSKGTIPDLKSLVQRVVSIFQPGRLSLTLFVSSKDNEAEEGESTVDAAQKAFKTALTEPALVNPGSMDRGGVRCYKRTDKINYEFGGYDLAFASYELK